MNRKQLVFALGAGLLFAAGCFALLLPLLARPSNCGGNSAALNNCNQILVYSRLFNGTNLFLPDVQQMDPDDRKGFLQLGESQWTANALYWVRTNSLDPKNPTQIVVFCDQVFDNVPQPTIGNFYKRTPAYAIGFANGTTALISPAAFAQLPKGEFAPIATLKDSYQP
jgi:hypothetical protein